MKKKSITERKAMKIKLAEALGSNIKTLSKDKQAILIDDLLTAFESRLSVLSKAESTIKMQTCVNLGMEIANETF